MNIVLFSHNGQLEGMPLILLQIAKQLQADGYNCTVVAPEKGPLKQLVQQKGIPFHVVPNLYTPLCTEEKVHDLLQRFAADGVVVNTLLGHELVKHAFAYTPDIPIVWHIQESEFHYYEHDPLVTEVSFAMASTVVFAAEATKRVYADFLLPGKAVVIANSVNMRAIETFRAENTKENLREKYRIARDERVISCVGTISPRKGQLDLVAALDPLMKNADYSDVRLVLTGKIWPENSGYWNQIESIAQRGGWQSRLTHIDATRDVFDIFGLSDIYACASYVESHPVTILEAMAFALPIVTTRCYGTVEQLIDRVSGLFVLPGQHTACYLAIKELLDNPGLGTLLGDRARQDAKHKHDEAEVLKRYTAVLDTHLKGPLL